MTTRASSCEDPARRNFMAAVAAMFVGLAVWLAWSSVKRGIWVDLDVYILGGRTILSGGHIYDVAVHDLPFTYSPFAACLFVLFAVIPGAAAMAVLTTISVGCYATTLGIFARRLGLWSPHVVLLGIGGATIEPFMRNILLGQINLVLIAMIVLDCLVVPAKWRGILVGIATGTKIIPGIYVLYFLLKRDFAAAARACATFFATVALAAIVDPSDSWRYWTGGFASTGKFGTAALAGPDNQSLLGVWIRMIGDHFAPTYVTALLCLLGVALGLCVARGLISRQREPDAVVAVAVGSLLASPVSWTHHWLWIVPALLVCLARRRVLAMWLLGALFWLGPIWLVHPGLGRVVVMNWWQQLVGAAYVIAGLALLATWTLERRPSWRRQRMRRQSLEEIVNTSASPVLTATK